MVYSFNLRHTSWCSNDWYSRSRCYGYFIRQLTYEEVRRAYSQWMHSIPNPRKVERVLISRVIIKKFARAYKRMSRGVIPHDAPTEPVAEYDNKTN